MGSGFYINYSGIPLFVGKFYVIYTCV